MTTYRCVATGCPLEGVDTEQSHEHVRTADGSIAARVLDMRRAPMPPPSLPVHDSARVLLEGESRPHEGAAVWLIIAGCVVLSLAITGLVHLIGLL